MCVCVYALFRIFETVRKIVSICYCCCCLFSNFRDKIHTRHTWKNEGERNISCHNNKQSGGVASAGFPVVSHIISEQGE